MGSEYVSNEGLHPETPFTKDDADNLVVQCRDPIFRQDHCEKHSLQLVSLLRRPTSAGHNKPEIIRVLRSLSVEIRAKENCWGAVQWILAQDEEWFSTLTDAERSVIPGFFRNWLAGLWGKSFHESDKGTHSAFTELIRGKERLIASWCATVNVAMQLAVNAHAEAVFGFHLLLRSAELLEGNPEQETDWVATFCLQKWRNIPFVASAIAARSMEGTSVDEQDKVLHLMWGSLKGFLVEGEENGVEMCDGIFTVADIELRSALEKSGCVPSESLTPEDVESRSDAFKGMAGALLDGLIAVTGFTILLAAKWDEMVPILVDVLDRRHAARLGADNKLTPEIDDHEIKSVQVLRIVANIIATGEPARRALQHCGGVRVLLNYSHAEFEAPLMKEVALFAVKNATDGDLQIQQEIEAILKDGVTGNASDFGSKKWQEEFEKRATALSSNGPNIEEVEK